MEPTTEEMLTPSVRFGNAIELERQVELQRLAGRSARVGFPFTQPLIDLSATAIETAGQRVATKGERIIYRREGSNPNGRLIIDVGGRLEDFYPGMVLTFPFDGFTVIRAPRSAAVGYAKLIVCTELDVNAHEPLTLPGEDLAPVNLLGNAGAGTFVLVVEDTQPSGAAPAGSFVASGWSKVRVTIDGQASNTLESVDLVPWFREPNSGIWFEQGGAMISLPDSQATAYRYRTFVMSTIGTGRMFLEIRNLAPGGGSALSFAVEGLE